MSRWDVLPTGAAQPIGWGSTVEEIDGIRVNAEGAMIVGDLLNGGRYLPSPHGKPGKPVYSFHPVYGYQRALWCGFLTLAGAYLANLMAVVLTPVAPHWLIGCALAVVVTLYHALRVHTARRAREDALRRLETARARRVAAGPDRLKPEGDEKAASVRVAAEAGLPYLDYESGEIWPPERAQEWLAQRSRDEAARKAAIERKRTAPLSFGVSSEEIKRASEARQRRNAAPPDEPLCEATWVSTQPTQSVITERGWVDGGGTWRFADEADLAAIRKLGRPDTPVQSGSRITLPSGQVVTGTDAVRLAASLAEIEGARGDYEEIYTLESAEPIARVPRDRDAVRLAEGWKPWPVDKARRTLEAIIKDARLVSRDRARGALTADQAESLLLDFSGEVQEGVLRAEIPSGPATAALKHFALTRKMLTTETERGDGR